MTNSNILPSSRAVLASAIDPDATAAGTVSSGWVSMAEFQSIMAIAFAGTLGASATFDAKLEQATDSSGTGAKDVTGKAITQLTQAGADESDQQAVINCRGDELDVAGGFNHVRLSITVATATSDAGGVVIGFNEYYGKTASTDIPANAAASVAEVVA